jgi:tetratricopeptide (TPR) repeat protein
MPQADLKSKFRNLAPVKSPPALSRINGCGVGLYGKRDFDDETQTYVATWCISLVYIPIVCLRAYRVATAQRGWYFLGREPLSSFARWWNISVLTAIVVTVVAVKYDAYTSSPAYKAHQEMARAAELVKQGRLADGATIYQSLALAGADESTNATGAMKGLVDGGCRQAPLSESAAVFASAARVARRGTAIPASEVAQGGMKLVAAKGDADPKGGVTMLDAIRPLVIDTRAIDARRLTLLRKWAAADPTNLDVITPLASLLEQQNELPEAKKLLLPVKVRLGDGDGARVLGTILAREGDFDGSYALLWPYVKVRLDRLHDAERNSQSTVKRLFDREIDLLDNHKGPEDFYAKYKNASSEGKKTLVHEYVNGRVKDDPEFLASQQALEQEAHVVPVALDLGVVMLQRAQARHDPTARKAQLESAEQVFLAISGVAGESDEYRLALGQIDYWLGRQVEGRKLFDDYLTSKGRAFKDLVNIGTRLRELGADPEARAMAEEAYTKATKPEEQHAAAILRSLLSKDDDDKIIWLNRSDTSDPTVKADLAKVLGDKAMSEGRDDEAVRQFHSAIDAFAAMPRSAMSLNETALAYYSIFAANGDRQSLDRCIDYFQQAVDLSPSDPILLFNAGITLLDGSVSDLIANDLDLRALHETGDMALLRYLYRDKPARDAMIARVKAHPGIARAVSYLEKVMVLSPKSERAPAAAYSVRRFTQDDAALAALEQRVRAAEINGADQLARLKEHLSGQKDQEAQVAIKAAIKRRESQDAAARAKGGVTAAVALDRHAEQLLALHHVGAAVDADNVVSLAEEAHRLAPSEGTHSTLLSAYLFRASLDLRRSDPAIETFFGRYERAAGTTYLMTVAASEPSAFQPKVIQHADVQRAIALIRQACGRYPQGRGNQEWALLKGADPGEAARIADQIRATPRDAVNQSIDSLLNPASVEEAIDTYWLMQILGKPEDGKAALARVVAMGVPVPVQP